MNCMIVILGYAIEILIIYKFWFSMLETRYSKRKSVVIYVIVSLINALKNFILFDRVTFRAGLTFVIHLILIYILFEDKILKKISVYALYIGCAFAAECAAVVLAVYVYKCDLSSYEAESLGNYLWQLTAYVLIFIFSTVVYILMKNKKITPDRRAVQYICLYMALQILLITMFFMLIVDYGTVSLRIFAAVLLVMAVSLATGVLIYKTVQSASASEANAEFLRKESEMKNEHFEKLKNQYVSYRRLRHDIYNHLRIIDEMDDKGKIKEYIAGVKEELTWFDDDNGDKI